MVTRKPFKVRVHVPKPQRGRKVTLIRPHLTRAVTIPRRTTAPHVVRRSAPIVPRLRINVSQYVSQGLSVHRRRRIRPTTIQSLKDKNFGGTVAGVAKTGPKPQLALNLPWPSEFKAAYVITIRPERYQGFVARMGPWAKHVKRLPGTNGAVISVDNWKKNGLVHPQCNLKRGQLGCYDSHVRIWKQIVADKIDKTVIFEDDANIRYTQHHANRIRQVLDEAEKLKIPYQFMYLGGLGRKASNYSKILAKPKHCNTLPAYVLTLEGAELLLKHSFPYRIPVDVVISNLHDNGTLKAVAMDPPLCFMVPVMSDTEGIH